MNKKGFTLVEVIVAVAILGVITALAFSGVTGLIDNNTKKKFEDYGQSVLYSAKIYVDSYHEDMFYSGGSATYCHKLTFDYLIRESKISDFSQKDISCNYPQSAVYVAKYSNGTYKYSVYLKCEDTSRHTILFDNTTNTDIDDLKQFKITY